MSFLHLFREHVVSSCPGNSPSLCHAPAVDVFGPSGFDSWFCEPVTELVKNRSGWGDG